MSAVVIGNAQQEVSPVRNSSPGPGLCSTQRGRLGTTWFLVLLVLGLLSLDSPRWFGRVPVYVDLSRDIGTWRPPEPSAVEAARLTRAA